MLPIKGALTAARGKAASGLPAAVLRSRGMYGSSFIPDYVSPNNGAPRMPSPWNKWFPYEPVPCTPQLSPVRVKVEGQEVYQYCMCGECRTQPWCEDNGGPGGCRSRGFASMPFIPRHTGTVLLCGCKHCPSRPRFNGTCWLVWTDYNIGPACLLGFVSTFVSGLVLTWMMHP
mmetsp:Transcript_34377/g.67703  ORF Transcript_34377/g.67703 Transcript_34377/m.67703 type:complete len:173 (-) Transcript_34377:58-576(-)